MDEKRRPRLITAIELGTFQTKSNLFFLLLLLLLLLVRWVSLALFLSFKLGLLRGK